MADPHPLTAALLTPSEAEVEAAENALKVHVMYWEQGYARCTCGDLEVNGNAQVEGETAVFRHQASAALTAAYATPERRALVEDVAAVIRAAEAGHARTVCGSCDAGLPMGCTCTPMDTTLASLSDHVKGEG